jgi:hypothetical protein
MAGVSLSSARGHATTPERPERAFAEKNLSRREYEAYRGRSTQLRERATEHVTSVLIQGAVDRIVKRLDIERVEHMMSLASPIMLRQMLRMDLEDLQNMASFQAPPRGVVQDWFVIVNGHWINPFWYH